MMILHYLPVLSYVVVFYNENSFVIGYNQDTPEQILVYEYIDPVWYWTSSKAPWIEGAYCIFSSGEFSGDRGFLNDDSRVQRPALIMLRCG